MSIERDVQTLSGTEVLTEEQKVAHVGTLQERKARVARVLERGVIADRLNVALPNGMYGEWVPDDPIEIDRMKSLGFDIDREHSKNRGIHTNADGATKVGDVIFMTCPQEQHELIQLVKKERFDAMHNPRGKGREGEEYRKKVETETPEIPVIDESRTAVVGKAEIEEALNRK